MRILVHGTVVVVADFAYWIAMPGKMVVDHFLDLNEYYYYWYPTMLVMDLVENQAMVQSTAQDMMDNRDLVAEKPPKDGQGPTMDLESMVMKNFAMKKN